MPRFTTIVFDEGIAPALSLSNPFELAVRRSVISPRQHPFVHLVGRRFGKVVGLVGQTESTPLMSNAELQARTLRLETEMRAYHEGDYMDSSSARSSMQVLYDEAFKAGQASNK